MDKTNNSKLIVYSEILFVILPLIVLLFISLDSNNILEIWKTQEISFVSIVLFGQVIVKLAAGVAKSERKLRWQMVSLIFSGLIVIGLVPSIIIYTFLVKGSQSTILYICQLLFLLISFVVYYTFGTIGQFYLDEKGK